MQSLIVSTVQVSAIIETCVFAESALFAKSWSPLWSSLAASTFDVATAPCKHITLTQLRSACLLVGAHYSSRAELTQHHNRQNNGRHAIETPASAPSQYDGRPHIKPDEDLRSRELPRHRHHESHGSGSHDRDRVSSRDRNSWHGTQDQHEYGHHYHKHKGPVGDRNNTSRRH